MFAIAILFSFHPPALAQSLAGQALAKARAGQHEEALELYREALEAGPDDIATLRDYAVVLGWAGKYPEAIPIIKRVRSIDNRQPEWALREFASIYLFGDATAEALRTLDELVESGDTSEQTINRRALALRWLGRYAEAEAAYRTLLANHANSKEGSIGLAYTLSDQGKYSDALPLLDSRDPQVVKAKIRILNWTGRHYEAQRLLDTLPASLADDREVLEDRIAAARWGGDPSGAMTEMQRLSSLYPGADTNRLSRDLETEYGHSTAPVFRFAKDSFGLVERLVANDVTVHVNPAHALHLGYQYRWFQQDRDPFRTLVRYDAGWSGNLSPRVSAYASAATVDYREPGMEKKFIGDGSIAFNVNDRLRLSGGGGSIVMDAYPALQDQITARFEFGEVNVRFNSRTQLQTRFSHYAFSDGVVRKRVDSQFTQTMIRTSSLKMNLSGRFGAMWHNAQTVHFWSPSRFQSWLASAQVEGRAARWLDYSGEVASGIQSEPGAAVQHPLQVSAKVAAHPSRHWRTVVEIAKSTSSLERVLPGQRTYSRWVFSAGMEFRLP